MSVYGSPCAVYGELTYGADCGVDHVAIALSRLAWQYQGLPVISGIVEIFASRWSNVSVVFNDIRSSRDLAGAVGDQLDQIGNKKKLPRPNGLADDPYRALIQAQIVILNNRGPAVKAHDSVAAVFPDAASIQYMEMYPMAFMFQVNEVDTSVLETKVGMLKKIRPTCYSATLVIANTGAEAPLINDYTTSGSGPFLGYITNAVGGVHSTVRNL